MSIYLGNELLHFENKYIEYCIEKMKKAKTKKDVYRIMTIWTNHVDKDYDWLIKEFIPEEVK